MLKMSAPENEEWRAGRLDPLVLDALRSRRAPGQAHGRRAWALAVPVSAGDGTRTETASRFTGRPGRTAQRPPPRVASCNRVCGPASFGSRASGRRRRGSSPRPGTTCSTSGVERQGPRGHVRGGPAAAVSGSAGGRGPHGPPATLHQNAARKLGPPVSSP